MKVIFFLLGLAFLVPAMVLLFKEKKKEADNIRVRRASGFGLLILAGLFAMCGKLSPETGASQQESVAATAPAAPSQIEESDKRTNTKCSICGRLFDGDGYEEVSEGVWKLCKHPYMSWVCSEECGLKHTREMNRIIESTNPNNTSNSSNYISGSGGPKTVGDTYDHEKECEVCEGRGWYIGAISGEQQKCLSCNGKGKIKY